jgi:hypothetical protein
MLQKWRRFVTEHRVSLLFLFRQFGVDPGLTALSFRRRRKWGDNIKKNFKELGYEGVSLIDLAHDRDKGRALSGCIKCRKFLD